MYFHFSCHRKYCCWFGRWQWIHAFNLCKRIKLYININTNFDIFFFNFINLGTVILREKALNLVNIYNNDLDTSFIEEIVPYQNIAKAFSKENLTINGLLIKLSNYSLSNIDFPQCVNYIKNICIHAVLQCEWWAVIFDI